MPFTTQKPITRLLKKQLKKTFENNDFSKDNIQNFVNLVNDAYIFYEEEDEFYRRAEEIATRDHSILNKKLKEKNSFLDTFNHGMAHDIKNHSSNIIGLISMLKKYTIKEDWKMIREITNQLESSSNQLTSIVQGFLYISRAEMDISEDFKEIDTIKLIEAIENEILFLRDGKKINLTFDLESVIFSEPILKIILVNLISNSIKYSKQNIDTIINISLKSDDNGVILSVIDNGIGIDLNDKNKKLFNLFNDSNVTKGYGVGLFLVKKITDKNNGIIKIESELNKGTQINIHFPNT